MEMQDSCIVIIYAGQFSHFEIASKVKLPQQLAVSILSLPCRPHLTFKIRRERDAFASIVLLPYEYVVGISRHKRSGREDDRGLADDHRRVE